MRTRGGGGSDSDSNSDVLPPTHPTNQLGIFQVKSVLTLSAWRQRQIPQVRGSVPQDGPPTHSSDSNLPTGCRPRGPASPSPGSTDLLEWLTELRGTLYQFMIKGRASRTARWERGPGSGVDKGRSLSGVESSPAPSPPPGGVVHRPPLYRNSTPSWLSPLGE